jgi:glycosyltransferase involved in cell wall biosynthesis
MQRAESWSEEHTGKVVHLVGRVTDKVIGFLGPAVDALAESGVDQVVVLVDDLRYRSMLPRLHDSVQLVLTPAARNPVRRWRWALEAFREVLRNGPVKVVQLHGFLPCLMGIWVARTTGIAAPMHYSPNGSESIGQVSSFAELLAPVRSRSGTIESPLEAAFFAVGRNESRHPLVVAGNRVNDPRCSELLAQLAVLLSGEALELAFNWVGTVDHGSRMRLKAANVGVFDVRTAADRASRLAAGWVYLAPGGAGEFPVHLVEAMAVGLPCVALDTPYHREVITHGVTGYLCRTEHEIVRCIAELIDSAPLRAQIGQAAREEARGRFSETKFRDSLFAAYDLPVKTRTEIQP